MAYQSASSAAPHDVPVHARPRQVSTFDPSKSREAVARLIVGAELPISFGENPFFEQFMQTFIPNYRTASRVTIRSDILKLFEKKKLELLDEFKRGTFSVALTSDVWIGPNKIMLALWRITLTEIGTSRNV